MRPLGLSVLLYIAAIILFILAALGVTIGGAGELDLIAFGLALFAAGHITT